MPQLSVGAFDGGTRAADAGKGVMTDEWLIGGGSKRARRSLQTAGAVF